MNFDRGSLRGIILAAVIPAILMLSGRIEAQNSAPASLQQAAIHFALGSFDAAEAEVNSYLKGNVAPADREKAIALLAEIRVERAREKMTSASGTGAAQQLGRENLNSIAGPRIVDPNLADRAGDSAKMSWDRSFPSGPVEQFRKDGVYAITASGRGSITVIRIHRSGKGEIAQQRIGNLLAIDFAETKDALPAGSMELPGGGATRIKHSQHQTDPLVARVVIDLRSPKVKATAAAGDDAVIVTIEDETSTAAENEGGEYRPPVQTAERRIELLGGNFQRGFVGEWAPQSLAVRVVDPRTGAPAAGATVRFYSPDPGMVFEPSEAVSGADGLVTSRARFDKAAGRKVVNVQIPGTPAEASFELYGLALSPDTLRKIEGDRVKVSARENSTKPLTVTVQDRYGNPIAGVPVKWEYVSGGGRVDARPAEQGDQNLVETDREGRAVLPAWTAGPRAGTHRVQASFAVGDVTRFTEFEVVVEPVLVTIDFYQAPVTAILRGLGELARWNLILSDGVLQLDGGAAGEEGAAGGKGLITVHFQNMPVDDALDKILAMKNLTRIENPDGSIKIVTFVEAQTQGQAVITDPALLDELPQDAVKTIVMPVNVTGDISAVVTAVRPLISTTGNIIVDPVSRKIVVTDYVSVIRRLRDVLSEFSAGEGYRIMTFQRLPISAPDIKTFVEGQIPVSVRRLFLGNNLVLIGPPEAMDRVVAILSAIEADADLMPTEADNSKGFEVIPLRQQKAAELAGILTSVFQTPGAQLLSNIREIREDNRTSSGSTEGQQAAATTTTTTTPAAGQQSLVRSAFQDLRDQVRIVAEPKTNSLILYGFEQDLEIVKQIIQRLDSINLQKETLTAKDVHFVHVKYRTVAEVFRVLNEILFPEQRQAEREEARTSYRYWWDYWYDGASGTSTAGTATMAQGQMRPEEEDTQSIPLRLISVPEPNLLIVVGGTEREVQLIDKIVEDLDQAVAKENIAYLQVYPMKHLLPSEFEKFLTETRLNEQQTAGSSFNWIDCWYFGRNCGGDRATGEGELNSFPIDAMGLLVVRARRVKHNQVADLIKLIDNPQYERRLDLVIRHYSIEKGNLEAIAEILNRSALNLGKSEGEVKDEFLFVDRDKRKIVVWAREGTQIRVERLIPQFDQPELIFDPALKYEIYEFRNITITEVIGVTSQAERSVVEVEAGFGQTATRQQNKTILQLISEPLGGEQGGAGRGVYPSVTGNFILVWGPTGAVDRAISFARQIDERWDKARISLKVYHVKYAEPKTFMNFIKGTIFGEDNRAAAGGAGGGAVRTQATEFLIPSENDPRTLYIWALPATHDRIATFKPIMDTAAFSFTNHRVFRVPGLSFFQANELAQAVSPSIRLFDIGDLWLSIGDVGSLQRLEEVMSAVTPAYDTGVPLYEIIRMRNRLASDVRRAIEELMGLGPGGSASLAALSFGGARANIPLSVYAMQEANALIITGGSPEQRLLVKALASELDEQPYSEDQFIRLYKLAFILPSEFDAFLQQTIVDERLERVTTGTASAEEGRTTVTQTITNAKRIALDSLKIMMVRTTREIHQQIDDLLKLIDKEDFGDKLELRAKTYRIKEADLDAISNVIIRLTLNRQTGIADEFLLIDRENRQIIVWAREGAHTKIERIIPTFDRKELRYDPGLRYEVYEFKNVSVSQLQGNTASGITTSGQTISEMIQRIATAGGEGGDRGTYLGAQGNFLMVWGPTAVVDRVLVFAKNIDDAWKGVKDQNYYFIPIKNVTPSDLRSAMSRVLAGHLVEIVPFDSIGNLLVLGKPDIIDWVRKVVADFDIPRSIRYYDLVHVNATTLSSDLIEMFPSLVVLDRPDQNRLAVQGSPEMLDQVGEVIKKLDAVDVELIEIMRADDDAIAEILRSAAFTGLYVEYQHQGPSHTHMVLRAANPQIMAKAKEFIRRMENVDAHLAKLTYISPVAMQAILVQVYQDLGPQIIPGLNAILYTATPEKNKLVTELIRKFDAPLNTRLLDAGRTDPATVQSLVLAFQPTVNITPLPGLSVVVAQGDNAALDAVQKMLKEIESGIRWQVYPLQNLDAAAVVTSVRSVFGVNTNISALPSENGVAIVAPERKMSEIVEFLRQMEGKTLAFVPVREAVPATVQTTVATFFPEAQIGLAGNQLIVRGDTVVIEQIRTFVEGIDRTTHTAIRPVRNYAPTTTDNQNDITALQATIAGYLNSSANVVYDRQSNAFVITDALERVQRALRVLDDLDRPPPQFLIEAAIIQVTITDRKNLGISWTIRPDLTDFSLDPPVDFTARAFGGAQADFDANGNFTVGIGRENLQATLSAIFANNDGRVITSPKLFLRNNVRGQITLQQAIPTVVRTVDQNGQVTFTSGTPQTIPISLDVIPTSSWGSDMIRLTIDADINFGDPATANAQTGQIPEVRRSINTTVDMKDGQTLILGGLMVQQEADNSTKVPFLGDLPGIGALFRTTAKRIENTEILVILTPRIVYPHTQELQMEEELNRFKYIVNFPADWTGRRWLVNNPQRGKQVREQVRSRSNFIVEPPTVVEFGVPASSPTPASMMTPGSEAQARSIDQSRPVAPPTGATATMNLNTATAAELKTLPGMPPHVAELVVRYREQNGNFSAVSELINVPGMTADILNRAAPYLRVQPRATPMPPPPQPAAQPSAPTPAPAAPGLVNINSAPAEVLMTLPGITEATARMIVAYRSTYGAFLTVEELIDVPGISPELYGRVRPFITTGTSAQPAAAARPAAPVQQPAAALVNINTASEAELAAISGFSTQNVKLILAYRNTYGPFPSVDALLNVPSITSEVLSQVRSRLTVGGAASPASAQAAPAPRAGININTATEAELRAIPEFSDQNIRLILAYRSSYGAFASVDDLLNVPTITQDLLNRVRDRLSVR